MKKLLKIFALGAASVAPLLVFGQPEVTFTGLLNQIAVITNATIPFILGLAVVVIVWGVFNYIVGAGDEEKRAEAKKYIIWGVIGVFIMLSVWGLVNVVKSSLVLQRLPARIPSAVPQTAVGAPCIIPATGQPGFIQVEGDCG